MGRTVTRRAVLAGAFAAALVLVGIGAAVGTTLGPRAHPAAGTDQLTVTVGSALAFTLSTDIVTPGDTVDVTLINTDGVDHTFTLSSVTNHSFDPNKDTTATLLAYFAAHAPLVNVSIPANTAPIHTTFTAPPYGLYEYVCLVPGHFPSMSGMLGSGEHGSTFTPNNGPGAPVFIIGGTIVTLVMIAIVLGFVAGRRKGAKHEMAPERLGYPEPHDSAGPPAH